MMKLDFRIGTKLATSSGLEVPLVAGMAANQSIGAEYLLFVL